jgi:hypothetical protein
VNDQPFPHSSDDGARPDTPDEPIRPPESEPPPWIVSRPPPAVHPQSSGGGRGRLPLVVGALAVVLLVLGGGAWFVSGRLDATSQSPAATTPGVGEQDGDGGSGSGVVEETPGSTPIEPDVDPQQVALARLEEIRRQDLDLVSLDGRYVAQLASKNPGIYDEFQTTTDGSHTFQATDVLEEHERLRDDPANGDARVVLVKSTDYGKRQLYRGAPLYVTFALGDFGSAQDVRSWCAGRFPALSAEALTNQCAARRLDPPS